MTAKKVSDAETAPSPAAPETEKATSGRKSVAKEKAPTEEQIRQAREAIERMETRAAVMDDGTVLNVRKSARYEETLDRAITVLCRYGLQPNDFWLLKNIDPIKHEVLLDGVIIGHTGCMKINRALPPEKQFRPSCITMVHDGYNHSCAAFYVCDDQGLYEVGEVNLRNCPNAPARYPYTLAIKRVHDKVVLINADLIPYCGLHTDEDSEAPEYNNEQTRKQACDNVLGLVAENAENNAHEPEKSAPQPVDIPKASDPTAPAEAHQAANEQPPADAGTEPGEQSGDAPSEAPIYCDDCRETIVSFTTRKGDTLTPQEIKKRTNRMYGRTLCLQCANKAKIAAAKAAAEKASAASGLQDEAC